MNNSKEMMPIHPKDSQHLQSVPMGLFNEEWAERNHGQSLARLKQRGGLDIYEMLANINHKSVDQAVWYYKEPLMELYRCIDNFNKPNPVGDEKRFTLAEVKEYLQHLPTCLTMQDWSEAIEAMSHTPQQFRDADYQIALDEMNEKMRTCSCGLDKILNPK